MYLYMHMHVFVYMYMYMYMCMYMYMYVYAYVYVYVYMYVEPCCWSRQPCSQCIYYVLSARCYTLHFFVGNVAYYALCGICFDMLVLICAVYCIYIY